MKLAHTTLVILAALFIAGCNASKSPEQAEATPEPVSTEPTPAPKIAEPVATPTPAPVAKRLAPDGVFFLLQPISITTDDGITKIQPGTKVTLVQETGDTLRLSDGQQEFDAQRGQFTNDLDIAAQIGRNHSAQQAAIAGWNQQQRLAMVSADQNKPSSAAKQLTDKEVKIQRLQARYDALGREDVALDNAITQSHEGDSRRGGGRITSKGALATQRPAMAARRQAINRERSQIYQQIQELKSQ